MLTRRRVLIGLGGTVGAVALGGCSGGDGSPAPAEGGSAGRVPITNRYGTYEIPLDPQRLVLMENRRELEIATAIGLTPTAVGYFFEFEGGAAPWVAPWVPYEPTGAEQTFESFATNTESLLAMRPDLILSGANWLDASDPPYWSYGALSRVAPVVPVGLVDTDWREDLRQVAGWMQRTDALDRTLAEFAELRDSIRSRYAGTLGTAQVAMGSAEDPALWLADLDSGTPASLALQELGGSLMPFRDAGAVDNGWLTLSPERIGELEGADAALIWGPDQPSRDALTSNPLWAEVPAVAEDRVIVSEQNVGSGHLYTVMECMRLWDRVYERLG
ncbi:ABC transporter substrate-binding protein [Pseudonocardia sp.]|uniref:ABC transporter substrate-binding protein n=1 Tax=Pseudonocardia sp. TaxID=60912 RepID=UPI002610EFB8|nr:ABC transporter substrate-binding protein [Pseudonocardia sp.]